MRTRQRCCGKWPGDSVWSSSYSCTSRSPCPSCRLLHCCGCSPGRWLHWLRVLCGVCSSLPLVTSSAGGSSGLFLELWQPWWCPSPAADMRACTTWRNCCMPLWMEPAACLPSLGCRGAAASHSTRPRSLIWPNCSSLYNFCLKFVFTLFYF